MVRPVPPVGAIVVGESVRLVSVGDVAREFGLGIIAARRMLCELGVPLWDPDPSDEGVLERVHLIELERALFKLTIRGAPQDPESLLDYMRWVSQYCGSARRKAVLDCLRSIRPIWKIVRRRTHKENYARGLKEPARFQRKYVPQR